MSIFCQETGQEKEDWIEVTPKQVSLFLPAWGLQTQSSHQGHVNQYVIFLYPNTKEFEDTKGVIRINKSKDRLHDGKKNNQ